MLGLWIHHLMLPHCPIDAIYFGRTDRDMSLTELDKSNYPKHLLSGEGHPTHHTFYKFPVVPFSHLGYNLDQQLP